MSNTEFINNSIITNDPDAGFEEVQSGDAISLDESMKVVEYKHRAPNITMEEGWKELPAEQRARYMHKLANAMNHAAKLLQDERNELLEKVAYLEKQVENAQKNLDIQKNVNRNAITQMNERMQTDATQTIELQGKLRQYETIIKAAGLSVD